MINPLPLPTLLQLICMSPLACVFAHLITTSGTMVPVITLQVVDNRVLHCQECPNKKNCIQYSSFISASMLCAFNTLASPYYACQSIKIFGMSKFLPFFSILLFIERMFGSKRLESKGFSLKIPIPQSIVFIPLSWRILHVKSQCSDQSTYLAKVDGSAEKHVSCFWASQRPFWILKAVRHCRW